MIFKWTRGSQGLRHVAAVLISSLFATLRKQIVCTKKIHEMDHADTSVWISSILFNISFNKAGKSLCFKRKSTSQCLVKKMLWGGWDKQLTLVYIVLILARNFPITKKKWELFYNYFKLFQLFSFLS